MNMPRYSAVLVFAAAVLSAEAAGCHDTPIPDVPAVIEHASALTGSFSCAEIQITNRR